jgi:HK97 family phage major capsid protein
MRKIAEIRQDLSGKIAEVKGIQNTAENADILNKGVEEMRALMNELNIANETEAAEQRLAEQHFENEAKKGNAFSFVKFVREAAEDKLSGIERDAIDAGKAEYDRMGLTARGYVVPSALLRASAGQNYTTAADGGNMIEQMVPRYIDALRNKLVIGQLGATVLTDLVGTLPVVKVGDVTAGWLAEGAAGSISKAAVAKATMTPHRAFVAMAFSRDLARQTSVDVERMLIEKLTFAHAQLIDDAAINGTGSNSQPTGILNNANVGAVAGSGANGTALNWANLVKLETTVNAANGNRGKLAYLTNAKVVGAMKSTERATNTARFLIEDGIANGYRVEMTNLVPSNLTKGTGTGLSAAIFGNWEDLYVGHWGGIDIVVDPYSLATYGDIRLILNAYNDVLVAEPASFAAIKDIIA